MDRKHAIDQLEALVAVPGALKVITNIPDPKGVQYPVTDVRHWVHHDIVALEQYKDGQYKALSGDYNAKKYGFQDRTTHDEVTGQPEALLKRLQEWQGD